MSRGIRRFFAQGVIATAMLVTMGSTSASAVCSGDCNNDGSVSISELVMGVSVVLGRTPITMCSALDLEGDAVVTVGELVAAVRTALEGCPINLRAKTFRSIQEVFDQSCSLPTCHSPIARQGGLVLAGEDVSYANLVDAPSASPLAEGKMRVASGDPANSFLIEKLRSNVPGFSMPQNAPPLSDEIIEIIEDWIERGAHTTEEECPALGDGSGLVGSGAHGEEAQTVCDDGPIDVGDFVWKPEAPLGKPAENEGIQLYVPPRTVESGTEWETCYAFRVKWSEVAGNIGIDGLPFIKRQEYRMHQGSHHLLVYAYFGQHTDWEWPEGHYPCSAGNCRVPGACPPDYGRANLPIGGTQVAGTRYQVVYPEGVGLPVLNQDVVIIANLHYTNPFQPAQDIEAEAWMNFYFHRQGEFKMLLDGVFAIGFRNLFVEPYESRDMSEIWIPRGLITGNSNAALFNLFGHMHKRGTLFQVDLVRDGACSVSGALCGRDSDCDCLPWQRNCTAGQTCVLGPNHEDTTIYRTTSWDNAPVIDYAAPYLRVNKEDGLRWTCTHVNGVRGDPTRPPKVCHEDCAACGWNDDSRTCTFDRGIYHGVDTRARIYQEGDPMPLVFGELADDDMCNLFGYFLQADQVDAAAR